MFCGENSGMKLVDFDNLCVAFAKTHSAFIKSDGLDAVKNALKNGTCVIESASAKNWIAPFFENLVQKDSIEYLTTELETDENNFLTGKFSTPNCKGIEKVRRIKERFPERKKYTLTAYGDRGGRQRNARFCGQWILSLFSWKTETLA